MSKCECSQCTLFGLIKDLISNNYETDDVLTVLLCTVSDIVRAHPDKYNDVTLAMFDLCANHVAAPVVKSDLSKYLRPCHNRSRRLAMSHK